MTDPSKKDSAMEHDQELRQWLQSLREESPTDLEMARWKQAVRAQAAKTAPKPRRGWAWKVSLELSKAAALLVAGFLAGDYYMKVYETGGPMFSQIAVSTAPNTAEESPIEISALSEYPLLSAAGVRVVDGQGRTWAEDLNLDSEFIGIATHRGTLVLSAYPFRGAEEAGEADGKQARLKFRSGLEIRLTAATPLLSTGGKAKLYALYSSADRTGAKGTVQVFEAETEDRILARLGGASGSVLSQ